MRFMIAFVQVALTWPGTFQPAADSDCLSLSTWMSDSDLVGGGDGGVQLTVLAQVQWSQQ